MFERNSKILNWKGSLHNLLVRVFSVCNIRKQTHTQTRRIDAYILSAQSGPVTMDQQALEENKGTKIQWCQNGLDLIGWPGTGLILPELGLGLVRKMITMAWPGKGLGLVQFNPIRAWDCQG